ncbi:hypothetical protein LW858_29395 (plasmid) [Bacillus cereus]|uniref:hypothetical protein n=1 Tax=Bacillus cereus TaxID=1396 RepID=UPI001F3F9ED2|nr:hypothetical protein [Bacillus cereus]UIJ69694.1 hypothetical protein LW858_29395 [Bacillus cereus]
MLGVRIKSLALIDGKKYPTIGYFIQKQANGQIRDGYYNSADLSLIADSNHVADYGYTPSVIDAIQKDLNQTYSVIWDGTSKLKRETNYQLLPDASGLQNDAAALANTNYAYEGSKYYFTVTPGSHKNKVATFTRVF